MNENRNQLLINNEKYYYFIIIVQLLIWIFFLLDKRLFSSKSSGDYSDLDNQSYYLTLRIFSPCDNCIDIRYQVWRLLSYSLIHLDLNHVLSNCICLLFYSYQNYYYPSKYLFLIYFYSVLLGGLTFIFFNPYSTLVGSSTGTYSLMGSSWGHQIINYSLLDSTIIIFTSLFNLIPLISVFQYYFFKSDSNIAHISHLYGFLGGLSISLIFFPAGKRHNYHFVARLSGVILLVSMSCFYSYGYYSLPLLNNQRFDNQCCYDTLDVY